MKITICLLLGLVTLNAVFVKKPSDPNAAVFAELEEVFLIIKFIDWRTCIGKKITWYNCPLNEKLSPISRYCKNALRIKRKFIIITIISWT